MFYLLYHDVSPQTQTVTPMPHCEGPKAQDARSRTPYDSIEDLVDELNAPKFEGIRDATAKLIREVKKADARFRKNDARLSRSGQRWSQEEIDLLLELFAAKGRSGITKIGQQLQRTSYAVVCQLELQGRMRIEVL